MVGDYIGCPLASMMATSVRCWLPRERYASAGMFSTLRFSCLVSSCPCSRTGRAARNYDSACGLRLLAVFRQLPDQWCGGSDLGAQDPVGQKIYAPKGIAALYIREGVALEPVVYGGGRNAPCVLAPRTPLAVALGAAAELAADDLAHGEQERVGHLGRNRAGGES